MATNQFQSHTGSDGSTPDQRMQQAGYTDASSTGENAYAYATSVDEAMQAFLIDWGVSDQGHRRNLLQPNVSSSNAYQTWASALPARPTIPRSARLVITQDFGSQPNQPAQLVGVAYYDNQNTGSTSSVKARAKSRSTPPTLPRGRPRPRKPGSTGGYQIAPVPASTRSPRA